MTLLYYDPRFLEHDTGRGHPERPDRVRGIMARLDETGVSARCARPACPPVSRERIERVHEAGYIDRLIALAEQGGAWLDPDTHVSPASPQAARLASGAACDAVDRILAGEDKSAFCVVRPPGHHALPERGMGFCLLNHIAIAARVATHEHHVPRVLIVDWDVHHGNGTQDTFYADGRVGYFSIHRWPFYPGTGAADETGAGDGLGATRNLPVPEGTTAKAYHDLFRRELADFADRIQPQLVLISAGFDAHRADPLGFFGLETEDFAELTKVVLDIAATHAEGRVVSILEGGYSPKVLAECAETHLTTMLSSG